MAITMSLYTIIKKWRDALKNSTELENYCLTNFGKKPSIFVGFDDKEAPGPEACPSVIIFPTDKVEGLEQGEYTYYLMCAWEIECNEVVQEDNVTEFIGLEKSDEFGQLLYQILNEVNPSCPISKTHYQLNTENAPYWPGFIHAEITIPVIMGAPMSY